MTTEAPKKEHLREVLLFMFKWKKTAVDSHKMIAEVYGEDAITVRACQKWFKRFREGDFDLSNKDRGRPSKKKNFSNLAKLLRRFVIKSN